MRLTVASVCFSQLADETLDRPRAGALPMNQSAFSNLEKSRRHIAAWLILALCMLFAFASAPAKAEDKHAGAPPAAEASGHGAEHAEAHHGITPEAPTFGDRSKGAWVNNSMIVTWIVAGLVIWFAQVATRRIRSTKEAALKVPTGAQNFWEFLVESLRNFLEEIIGRDLTRKTFWFFASVFIFILFVNWFGLLPGVGTIGWGHDTAQGFHVDTPLFRGGNADLNMTLAMSLVFFACWLFWAFSENGIGGFVLHLFGNPARKEMTGFLKLAMAVIFVLVGLIEVVSILFRPVSLSFRLYGNIFAGENLLESMSNLIPAIGGFLPIPFYFMELLVGLVQALVFMMLTAVFTLLICSHGDDHGREEGKTHH
jgi:F-type H+-transporting ATPase subunit a